MNNTDEIADAVARFLVSKKAGDVLVIDLRETAPFICDSFVVATAFTRDHAKALARDTEDLLADMGLGLHHKEGYDSGKWVLLDAGELVVHIMLRELREFYALESLWADAPLKTYDDTEAA